MPELRTSIVLNLSGNLAARAAAMQGSLGRLGRVGRTAFRGMGSAVEGTFLSLARLGGRYSGLLTGTAFVAGTVAAARRAMQIEERIERLGVQAKASTADMKAMWVDVQKSAATVNLKPDELLAAVEEIVEKTGDLGFAAANLDNLAAAIQATGAGGENIGAIAAELQKMGLVKPDEVIKALDILNVQGKEGAFTLQALAALGPRVMAAYTASGRGGIAAIREMGAALQMIRMGTGSSEQAATAFEALMRTLQDADKIKLLTSGGIRLFEDDGTTLRPINELMAEIVRATQGRSALLSEVFDAEAMRAFNAASSEFLRTGKLERLEKFFGLAARGDTLADARRIAATAGAKGASLTAKVSDAAAEFLEEPTKRAADFAQALSDGTGRFRTFMNLLGSYPDIPSAPGGRPRRPALTLSEQSRRLAEQTGDFERAQARLRTALPDGKVTIKVEAEPGTKARVDKIEGRGLDVDSGRIMTSP